MTVSGGIPDLGEDVGFRAHPLVAAGIRYDAEATELVAPFDDRDVRLDRIVAPGHSQGERHIVKRIEVDDGTMLGCRCRDQHRQPPDRLRSDDDVGDTGRAAQDGIAFLLRDATGNSDDRIVTLLVGKLPKLAQACVQLVLGPLTNAAGVDHDHVRVTGLAGGFITSLLEQAGHALRVVNVHLTAERFDQILSSHP